MTDLRPCPFCGGSAKDGHGIKCFMWRIVSGGDWRQDWNTRPIEDALLDRALTAEARVAQLERAIAEDPLESERLRALIREALYLIGQGHEPGEYAESVWVSQIVATLMEADHGNNRPEP